MDDEEGRARYWIWPLRIHAVVSCKNRSSHRRDYLTSKESHQNWRLDGASTRTRLEEKEQPWKLRRRRRSTDDTDLASICKNLDYYTKN